MIYMIATIKDCFKNTIGFRLLDTDTKQVMETQKASVIMALQQGKVSIANLEIDGDSLVGYNGAIDRYPTLNQQMQLMGKSPVIILHKTDERTFVCCDFKGETITIDEARLLQYVVGNGIANGKVAKGHIAAIEGLYETLYKKPIQNKQGVDNQMSKQVKNTEKPKKTGSFMEKLKEYTRSRQLLGETGGNINFKLQGKDVIISEVSNTITELAVPDFVTKLGDNVCYLCGSLKKVTIPESVTAIGNNAFNTNNNIKFHVGSAEVGMILVRAGINKNQITLDK